jgi:hypothetical protein
MCNSNRVTRLFRIVIREQRRDGQRYDCPYDQRHADPNNSADNKIQEEVALTCPSLLQNKRDCAEKANQDSEYHA